MSNTWLELDRNALAGNIRAVQRALRPGTRLVFVVKANGYGHGMAAVARCAWLAGVRWFMVAHLEEALGLRAALPRTNILLLGQAPAAAAVVLAEARITPILFDFAAARSLAAAARARRLVLPCHVKVDTGMGRLGLAWESAPAQMAALRRAGGLRLEGLCTHLAAGGRRGGRAGEQGRRFQNLVARCAALGLDCAFKHMSNSAAFLAHPEWDYDGVRCGILLYGYGKGGPRSRARTQPVLQWKTTVLQVKSVPAGFFLGYDGAYRTARPTVVATVNAGYADGYPRQLGNRSSVLIGGRRAPVAGRVSMNFITVDAGPRARVRPGDEVVLIGRQGRASVWADELAALCRTIPYEILTGIRN
jgi:alanine racemase